MSIQEEDKFKLGASYTIGSYILPGITIDTIHQKVNRKIKLTIAPSSEIIKAIRENKLDLGFIETPLFDNTLVYKKWIDDEMVVCSKKRLPNSLNKNDLSKCKLLCSEEGSQSSLFIENFLKTQGLSYSDFNSISEIDNPASIIQSIKWSKPNTPISTVAIVSKVAIEYELNYNNLYESSINNTPIIREFYMVYNENSKYIDVIKHICNELM
jgi:DNA-binding transcriptional LysR family regulator